MSTSSLVKPAVLLGLVALGVLGYLRVASGAAELPQISRMVVESTSVEEPPVALASAPEEAEPPVVEQAPQPWTLLDAPSTSLPSPAELQDRRLDTVDALLAPESDTFVSTIQSPPPAEVLARSSWDLECPVLAVDLAYVQVSFFGFDGDFHTGELLIAEDYAGPVTEIFERLHELRFPIEQMIVVSRDDFGVPSNAYTNNTSSFECRRSVTSGRWSRHAYGDAIDINPFHNPYVSGGRVIPALAGAYADRDREVPGIITTEITAMFEEIGWGWGGDWNSIKDWMHFSATGT